MSILTKVESIFDEYERIHGEDDIDVKAVLSVLSDEERRIWCEEVDLQDELFPKYGTRPDFDYILEREIYARGLETK